MGCQSGTKKEYVTSATLLSHGTSLRSNTFKFLHKGDHEYLPCSSHRRLGFLLVTDTCARMFSHFPGAKPGHTGAGIQILIFLTPKQCHKLLVFLPSNTYTEPCEGLTLLYAMHMSLVLSMVILHGLDVS